MAIRAAGQQLPHGRVVPTHTHTHSLRDVVLWLQKLPLATAHKICDCWSVKHCSEKAHEYEDTHSVLQALKGIAYFLLNPEYNIFSIKTR